MMHAARLASSKRLQDVLQALTDAGDRGLTTREIIDLTGVCAVNSIVSELRKNGHSINCKFQGRTVEGSSVFRYRLVK
jgi:hypothetical protein